MKVEKNVKNSADGKIVEKEMDIINKWLKLANVHKLVAVAYSRHPKYRDYVFDAP